MTKILILDDEEKWCKSHQEVLEAELNKVGFPFKCNVEYFQESDDVIKEIENDLDRNIKAVIVDKILFDTQNFQLKYQEKQSQQGGDVLNFIVNTLKRVDIITFLVTSIANTDDGDDSIQKPQYLDLTRNIISKKTIERDSQDKSKIKIISDTYKVLITDKIISHFKILLPSVNIINILTKNQEKNINLSLGKNIKITLLRYKESDIKVGFISQKLFFNKTVIAKMLNWEEDRVEELIQHKKIMIFSALPSEEYNLKLLSTFRRKFSFTTKKDRRYLIIYLVESWQDSNRIECIRLYQIYHSNMIVAIKDDKLELEKEIRAEIEVTIIIIPSNKNGTEELSQAISGKLDYLCKTKSLLDKFDADRKECYEIARYKAVKNFLAGFHNPPPQPVSVIDPDIIKMLTRICLLYQYGDTAKQIAEDFQRQFNFENSQWNIPLTNIPSFLKLLLLFTFSFFITIVPEEYYKPNPSDTIRIASGGYLVTSIINGLIYATYTLRIADSAVRYFGYNTDET
jgi:hypothetical protein